MLCFNFRIPHCFNGLIYYSSYASVSCSVKSFATQPPFPLSSHTTQHYIVLSRCRCKQTTQSYPGSSVKSMKSTFIMLLNGRCRFDDSTSSHTTKTIFCEFQTFTLLPFIMPSRRRCRSQNSNVKPDHVYTMMDAGADLKIQMSIRPCTIYHSLWYQDAGADLKIQMSSQTISSYMHTKLLFWE